MPVFKSVAEGSPWTRTKQQEFEDGLASSNVKTDGSTRSDSGGKRTWAVYPKIFGLWYEHENKVVLTAAAEKVILGGVEAVKQIRHQILRFQWPNRTQEHRSQSMDESFKIFPYRFLFKLLLDNRLRYLTTSEISLFVLQVKNDNEFESTIKNILKFRKKKESDKKSLRNRSDLIEDHKKFRPGKNSDPTYTVEDHYKYVTDLANTFMNHLEFFEEIIHERSDFERENQIRVDDEQMKNMEKIINTYDKKFPFSLLTKYSDTKWFVENYGNRYDRTKASKKTTKPKGKIQKDIDLIESVGNEVLREKTSVKTVELVLEISRRTGINKSQIAKIVSSNSESFGWGENRKDNFLEKYLEISGNGKMHVEFEDKTRKIFQSFGFPAEKLTFTTQTGNQLEIDGFVQNKSNSGVIDAKSGKKFSCNNKEVGIMKDYIKNFKEYEYNDNKFNMAFFAYVYGKKFENEGNFKRIIQDSGISGARISAIELVKLKVAFDSKDVTKEEIWKLFQKNGEITSVDY